MTEYPLFIQNTMKIKHKTFKTTSIVFFVLALVYLWVWYFAKSLISSDQVCHQNHCFIVELAQTQEERNQWLMYREFMEKNRGMLFIFQENKNYPFWMKNTVIPLDMIRIDSGLNIVDIQTAQPCITERCPSYIPKDDSLYVLEINAWLSQEYDISIWDLLKFKLKK